MNHSIKKSLKKTPNTNSFKSFEKALSVLAKSPFGQKLETPLSSPARDWANTINSNIEKGKAKITSLERKIKKIKHQFEASEKTKNQIKESMGELLKFQKLSEAISVSHNIKGVLDALEQLSSSIIPVSGIGVFLFEKQAKNIIPIRTNLTKEALDVVQEQLEEGIIDWVIRERRPAVIPDIKKLSANNLKAENNFIIIPLIVRGKSIGVCHLYTNTSKSDFTRQQMELLAMLSNVAAVAIENTQLYEQMNRTIKKLAVLYETGKQVASVLKPQQVYDTAIHTLCKKLNVSMGWIYEVSSLGSMILKASSGNFYFPESLKNETPFHETIKRGDAILFTEYRLHKYIKKTKNFPAKAVICVPFFHHGAIVGVIGVACAAGEEMLEQSHLRLLKTLATQVGIAIENSRLYQELLLANRQLTDMQGQLIHSGRLAALGQLSGGVAHEINNPLQIILGRVQMVLMDINDETHKNELKIIESETKRIASIVRNLLELARKGEKAITFIRIDLNSTLKEALVLIRHQMEIKNIEIKEIYDESLPDVIGNKNMLKQVFLNICINAEHAMGFGEEFKVHTYFDKRWVFIDFTDTGIGVPMEIAGKIFEPFFTTKEDIGGSGLGLSVSRDIIKKHKGSISVTSKLNKGSTFRVKLPVPGDS